MIFNDDKILGNKVSTGMGWDSFGCNMEVNTNHKIIQPFTYILTNIAMLLEMIQISMYVQGLSQLTASLFKIKTRSGIYSRVACCNRV